MHTMPPILMETRERSLVVSFEPGSLIFRQLCISSFAGTGVHLAYTRIIVPPMGHIVKIMVPYIYRMSRNQSSEGSYEYSI